jgi:hypothetical protein
MKTLRLIFFLLIILTASLAQADTTPSSGSSIRIKKIQPSIAQTLKPGEKVTFVVELEYTLAVESGAVALIIQRAEGDYASLAEVAAKLSQGSGNLTLQTEVEIPQTTTIRIFTPLYHSGDGSSSIVDGRVYEVGTP